MQAPSALESLDTDLQLPQPSHRRIVCLHIRPESHGQHRQLLRNEIYDEMLGDWRTLDYEMTTSLANSKVKERTERTETVWMNYDPNEGQGALAL